VAGAELNPLRDLRPIPEEAWEAEPLARGRAGTRQGAARMPSGLDRGLLVPAWMVEPAGIATPGSIAHPVTGERVHPVTLQPIHSNPIPAEWSQAALAEAARAEAQQIDLDVTTASAAEYLNVLVTPEG
jgi:hypothetical protein